MTLVVNKITKPGDIRRVDLEPDKVTVTLYDHKQITYIKATVKSPPEPIRLEA
jgi:hypothetical protein